MDEQLHDVVDVDQVDDVDALGPEFEPATNRQSAEGADLTHALAGGENWSASRIESLLQAQGSLVHGALAVEKGTSQEWLYTQADLKAIAPPLARIMNRYPATRAAAAGGDELAVAVGFAGYAARSYQERRMALQLRAASEQLHQVLDQDPTSTAPAAAAAPEPAPEPLQTAADAYTEPAWPAEGETPPIAPRR